MLYARFALFVVAVAALVAISVGVWRIGTAQYKANEIVLPTGATGSA